jgi:hypothetical protein
MIVDRTQFVFEVSKMKKWQRIERTLDRPITDTQLQEMYANISRLRGTDKDFVIWHVAPLTIYASVF